MSADGTTSAPSLSPSINPGYSTQGFAESQPRQLAPSVGKNARWIQRFGGSNLHQQQRPDRTWFTAINLHRQRRLDRIWSSTCCCDIPYAQLLRSNLAAAFRADARIWRQRSRESASRCAYPPSLLWRFLVTHRKSILIRSASFTLVRSASPLHAVPAPASKPARQEPRNHRHPCMDFVARGSPASKFRLLHGSSPEAV